MDEIIRLARQFRSAIERTDKALLPVGFGEFPRGACGDTAEMLAVFLREQNCGAFEYVCGYRGIQSHAWAQRDRLIVDITGDQFSDCPSAVIVTTRSAWHAQFREREKRQSQGIAAELRAAYAEVLRQLSVDELR